MDTPVRGETPPTNPFPPPPGPSIASRPPPPPGYERTPGPPGVSPNLHQGWNDRESVSPNSFQFNHDIQGNPIGYQNQSNPQMMFFQQQFQAQQAYQQNMMEMMNRQYILQNEKRDQELQAQQEQQKRFLQHLEQQHQMQIQKM